MLLFNKDGQFCQDGDEVVCALSIDPNTGEIASVLLATENAAPVLRFEQQSLSLEQRMINDFGVAFRDNIILP